jgi:hypothetical protein
MVNGLVVSNLLFHTILGWLADMNHDFWDGLPSGNLLHSYRKILKMAIDRWFTMIYLQKTSKNVELFHGYLSLQEASKKFRTHRVVHNTKVVLHSAPAAPRWRWVHGSCPKAGTLDQDHLPTINGWSKMVPFPKNCWFLILFYPQIIVVILPCWDWI